MAYVENNIKADIHVSRKFYCWFGWFYFFILIEFHLILV